MSKHYADKSGRYIGAFGEGVQVPAGAVERPAPPHAAVIWRDGRWAKDRLRWRKGARMSRSAFALAAADAGLISDAEAEDWVAGVAIPAWVAGAIDAAIAAGHVSNSERMKLRVAVRTQAVIRRSDQMIPLLAGAKDISPESVDALFGFSEEF